MKPPARGRGSLTVVGAGITAGTQMTLEAVNAVRRADRVLYVVANPAIAVSLGRLNPAVVSLEDSYAEGKPRARTYREMADRIVAAVREGLDVCVVFYGHPGVAVDATHQAIRRARREGFAAKMLPGISSDGCLFADLGIDPARAGCQIFEASDFLSARRRFDPTSALILWQVGLLGEASVRPGMSCRPARLKVLAEVLRRHYPARHRVILYEAAQYPGCDPLIRRVRLDKLAAETIPPAVTLYVPPLPERTPDPRVARWFAEGQARD
jgi:precorrin-3B methylase